MKGPRPYNGVGGQRHPRHRRFNPRKGPVTILKKAGWVPGLVWTVAENLFSTRFRTPNRPARSESLYRLRYPGPAQSAVSSG